MKADIIRNQISLYRNELMGFSILWIILHHTQFFQMANYGYLDYLIRMGSCGVDIFLFLSSFGLYRSFSQNNNIKKFYLKRILRIFPTFIFIVFAYNLKDGFTTLLSPWTWINELYCNWFITFILLMYGIFPLLYKIQQKGTYLPVLATSILSIFITIILIITGHNDIHDVPMLMGQRLPIFCLGMLIADKHFKSEIRHYSLKCFIIIIAICFIFYYNVEDFLYYAFFFLTLPLLLILCKIFNYLPTTINKLLTIGGRYSLELYLTHMKIIPLILTKFKNLEGIILTLLISFFVSVIIKVIIKWTTRNLYSTKLN